MQYTHTWWLHAWIAVCCNLWKFLNGDTLDIHDSPELVHKFLWRPHQLCFYTTTLNTAVNFSVQYRIIDSAPLPRNNALIWYQQTGTTWIRHTSVTAVYKWPSVIKLNNCRWREVKWIMKKKFQDQAGIWTQYLLITSLTNWAMGTGGRGP